MYTLTTTQFNFVQSARPFLPTQPTDMFEFSLLNTIACKAGYSIVPAWIMSEDSIPFLNCLHLIQTSP